MRKSRSAIITVVAAWQAMMAGFPPCFASDDVQPPAPSGTPPTEVRRALVPQAPANSPPGAAAQPPASPPPASSPAPVKDAVAPGQQQAPAQPAASPAPSTAPPPANPPAPAPPRPMKLVLPTDNDALFTGDMPRFYMWVERSFEKETTQPWEGGQYGYVRGPVRVGEGVAFRHFHEGIDIAPTKRDAQGEPLDEVRSISDGEVVHVSDNPRASNYGRYIVVKHDWGQGPFYSLYAHLSKSLAQEGQKVEPGTPIAIMGHTGEGINKLRSHTHVEINMMMNTHYGGGYDPSFKTSPSNPHGMYNGLNLTGFDIAGLFLMYHADPSKTVLDFIRTIPVEWKCLVPRTGEPELIKIYPWLGEGAATASPSWEISFSDDGLPLKFAVSQTAVAKPTVSWVKDDGLPHTYHTRGCVSGSGDKFQLTGVGLNYIQLVTGDLPEPPKTAAKAPAAKTPASKAKAKKTKKPASQS